MSALSQYRNSLNQYPHEKTVCIKRPTAMTLAEPQIRDLHKLLTAAINSLIDTTERELGLVRTSDPMGHAWIAHMTAVSTLTGLCDALMAARKTLRED